MPPLSPTVLNHLSRYHDHVVNYLVVTPNLVVRHGYMTNRGQVLTTLT